MAESAIKRAAIQISGEFRCLHICGESFQTNVIEPLTKQGYVVDIYVHCWKRDTTSYGTFKFEGRNEWHLSMPVFSNSDGLAMFKPSGYLFESLDDKEFLKGRSRILAMYYSIYMANMIRKSSEQKHGIKYDLVMRWRTDCILTESLFSTIPDQKSFLVIPISSKIKSSDGPLGNFDTNHICDLVAYGTGDMMDIYTETFLLLVSNPNKDIPIGEVCLAKQLNANNVKPIRPYISFFLVEGNGQIRGDVVV